MKRIRVLMLKKDRSIGRLMVGAGSTFFRYAGGIYNIDRDAVNMIALEKEIGKDAELIYLEERPSAIGSKTDPKRLLNQKLIENAIKHSAKPKGQIGLILAEYAKDPGKLLMLVFVLTIAGSIIASVLGLV